jgi:hypothetical protein
MLGSSSLFLRVCPFLCILPSLSSHGAEARNAASNSLRGPAPPFLELLTTSSLSSSTRLEVDLCHSPDLCFKSVCANYVDDIARSFMVRQTRRCRATLGELYKLPITTRKRGVCTPIARLTGSWPDPSYSSQEAASSLTSVAAS